MLKRKKLSEMMEWKQLQKHYDEIKKTHLRDLFETDPDRADRFSIKKEGLYFDYSKNIINEETLKLLFNLAEACSLKEEIERMFNGEKINETENRAVLHIALRNVKNRPIIVDGEDVSIVANAVNTNQQPGWYDPLLDINNDGFVDKEDIHVVNSYKGTIIEDITDYVDTNLNIIYGTTSHFSVFRCR